MAAGHDDTFHHVRDFPYFELPETLGLGHPIYDDRGHQIAHGLELPAFHIPIINYDFQLTKFMVLQVVAGLLTLLIFGGLARRIRDGATPRGGFWNFWEVLVQFLRDEVVRPTIGEGHEHHGEHVDPAGLLPPGTPSQEIKQFPESSHGHPADKFLPFIATCFFYILFCNLLGMVPWLGSPTGNISVTGVLAISAFTVVIISGSQAMGVVGFWKAQVPDMGLTGVLNYTLVPLVWLIEVVGLFIKHSVLAIRLFANIMAGHTVLGVLLAFIAGVAGTGLFYPVLIGSVGGQVFVYGLELLFAFIQAYVFAFLTTVFISMALHPH